MKTLIRHGRLVLPSGIEESDLLVMGDRIAAIGTGLEAGDAKEIDAEGCYVLPGLMDFHTHVEDRIGRFQLADDYESATRIAALNGITTLCTFVTQPPGSTLREAIQAARRKAHGRCHTDVAWHLTPTTFSEEDWRDMETFARNGYLTFKFYTTYKEAGICSDPARLEEVFRRLGPLGVRFLVHCEDDDQIGAVDASDMDLSQAATHAMLRPEEAEVRSIQAILALATRSHVLLHIVHVSTLAGAEAVRSAKRFLNVTCETCPQYLWLEESRLDGPDGHRWICSPPLRRDRDRFRELARDGAFDLIGTDHCPFSRQDKDDWDGRDIRMVANGLAGIGALPHLAWRLWEHDPDQAALELARRVSFAPALRLGYGDCKGALRPGLDADIAILDPRGPQRALRSSFADVFETYPGFQSPLSFRHVLLRGRCLVQEGKLCDPSAPFGRPLQEPV